DVPRRNGKRRHDCEAQVHGYNTIKTTEKVKKSRTLSHSDSTVSLLEIESFVKAVTHHAERRDLFTTAAR
ncbi:uncharacterized, partial [Tachysurus ichikawai]